MAACGASLNSVSDGEARKPTLRRVTERALAKPPKPALRRITERALAKPPSQPCAESQSEFSEAPKPALRRITERV